MRKERIIDTQMRYDRSAEIARQQNGTDARCGRHGIQDGAQ